MKRGAVTKKDAQIVAVWLPDPLLKALDKAVLLCDTDRSKLIRKALRKEIGHAPKLAEAK